MVQLGTKISSKNIEDKIVRRGSGKNLDFGFKKNLDTIKNENPIIYIDGNNTDGFIEKCANKCNDHKDCVGFVLDTAEYPKNNKPGDRTYYSKCWLKKDILDTKYSDHYNGDYYKNVKKDTLRSTFRKQ